jgi:hypothetical protein
VALVVAFVIESLVGCAVLSDKRTAAGCQLADGITTYDALARGAREINPFFESMSGTQILVVKAIISGLIMTFFPEYEEMSEMQKTAAGALSIVGCGAAINNYGVQR